MSILTFETLTVDSKTIVAIEKMPTKEIRIHVAISDVSDSFDVKMDYTAAIMIWKAGQ